MDASRLSVRLLTLRSDFKDPKVFWLKKGSALSNTTKLLLFIGKLGTILGAEVSAASIDAVKTQSTYSGGHNGKNDVGINFAFMPPAKWRLYLNSVYYIKLRL